MNIMARLVGYYIFNFQAISSPRDDIPKKKTNNNKRRKQNTHSNTSERDEEWKQEKYKIICACVRANWVSVMCIFDAALNSSCRFKDSQAKINVWPKNVRFVFKNVPHASQIKPSKRSVRVCNVYSILSQWTIFSTKLPFHQSKTTTKKHPAHDNFMLWWPKIFLEN